MEIKVATKKGSKK